VRKNEQRVEKEEHLEGRIAQLVVSHIFLIAHVGWIPVSIFNASHGEKAALLQVQVACWEGFTGRDVG
jgi:hypothetical protein